MKKIFLFISLFLSTLVGAQVTQTVSLAPSLLSAFGTLETNELTPVMQGDFVYGLNTQIWNTGVTNGAGASVGTSSGKLTVQSGTASGNYAYITSKKIIRYRAGQGTTVRFTPVFTTGVANTLQLIGVGTIASNAPYDGYFFGYNGTAFGIAYYNGGTLTWIPQSSWNGYLGTFNPLQYYVYNPTYGSPVMIKYPYLGFGSVEFYIESPAGSWILVHTINYPNTSSSVELSNPSLQFTVFTSASATVTNMTASVGSVGMFISGTYNSFSNPKEAADNSKSGITTETCIINILNCTSYNGVTNHGMIRLHTVGLALGNTSNNNNIFLRIKINGTIGGTPSYTPQAGTTANNGLTITSGNSIASYDVAGTTISGGTMVVSIPVGTSGNQVIDITSLNILLAPGDIASFTVTATVSSQVGVSVNWSEDI